MLPPEPPIFDYSDILIYTGYAAVAPKLEEVMRQAHQTPFSLGLLQPTQAEAPESPRSLDLTEHRFHHPFAQAVYRSTPRSLSEN
jgi:hypothetical protein